MSKKEIGKHSEKYYAVLKKFHLAPDFKLNDYEKEIVKFIDKAATSNSYDLADEFDLRPSEVKELVDGLVEKGVLKLEENVISLTDAALQYVHASKEERKTEKKFRKFLDTLDEKDLDKFLNLVDSFVVKEMMDDNKEKKGK